jgi:hypothetical protein
MPFSDIARARSAKTVAVLALAAVSLTGCVGILPNTNTEEGRKKITEIHSVVYTVKAPFGTKITYGNGNESFTGQTDNFGEWSETVDVKGIVSVTIDVAADDASQTVTCDITVDDVEVATGFSNGDGHATCHGSTSKT